MRNRISTIFKTAIGIALLLGMMNVAVAQLPDPGMTITPGNTALVITDPQNDFLSPKGVTWGVVGESVTENNTVANIESLFKAAKQNGVPVFISPHYYYPTDKGWQFEGALETLMHAIGMFDRTGALDVEGFEDSGADWLSRYKPYIDDGETIVASPHKVYGPENNDLLLQLRKHLPACRRTSAWKRICANSWNAALKYPWSRTVPQPRSCPRAMDMKRHS
jgi:nicotinamidase-related amidase